MLLVRPPQQRVFLIDNYFDLMTILIKNFIELNTEKCKVKISINILIQNNRSNLFYLKIIQKQWAKIDQISASSRLNYIVS